MSFRSVSPWQGEPSGPLAPTLIPADALNLAEGVELGHVGTAYQMPALLSEVGDRNWRPQKFTPRCFGTVQIVRDELDPAEVRDNAAREWRYDPDPATDYPPARVSPGTDFTATSDSDLLVPMAYTQPGYVGEVFGYPSGGGSDWGAMTLTVAVTVSMSRWIHYESWPPAIGPVTVEGYRWYSLFRWRVVPTLTLPAGFAIYPGQLAPLVSYDTTFAIASTTDRVALDSPFAELVFGITGVRAAGNSPFSLSGGLEIAQTFGARPAQ